MSNPLWSVITLRGFNLAEATSALQKAIRRGEEEAALTFAVEIDQSGYGAMLWNRLLIITSEDVGIAWMEGPAVIGALHQNWLTLRKAKNPRHPERLMVIHAVLALVRAPKTRIVDNALWATYCHEEPLVKEIPDYALDSHTLRGRRMGRTKDTYREGYELVNETVPSPYKDRARLGSVEWKNMEGPQPDQKGLF